MDQSNNPVLNLFDEITAVVREADEAEKKGEEARTTGHAKTYKALAMALRLHRLASESDEGRSQLDQLYQERKIKKPRGDANPFTRLAKLCFPGRTSVDYSRYAAVLSFTPDEQTLLTELEECGLTLLAQIAKDVRTGETRAEASLRAQNAGFDILAKRDPIATVELDLPEDVGLALLIRREDGKVDVHYHTRIDDAEEARNRLRRLGRKASAQP